MAIPDAEHIKNLKKHCIKRALERYDLILTDEIIRDFITEIELLRQEKKYRSESYRREQIFKVPFQGTIYDVVYNTYLKCLVTFLPKSTNNKKARKNKKTTSSHFGEH